MIINAESFADFYIPPFFHQFKMCILLFSLRVLQWLFPTIETEKRAREREKERSWKKLKTFWNSRDGFWPLWFRALGLPENRGWEGRILHKPDTIVTIHAWKLEELSNFSLYQGRNCLCLEGGTHAKYNVIRFYVTRCSSEQRTVGSAG